MGNYFNELRWKIIILSQFQIFLNQTLCVFSQMKDAKHFRRDFHFIAWVMPQGDPVGIKTSIFWTWSCDISN